MSQTSRSSKCTICASPVPLQKSLEATVWKMKRKHNRVWWSDVIRIHLPDFPKWQRTGESGKVTFQRSLRNHFQKGHHIKRKIVELEIKLEGKEVSLYEYYALLLKLGFQQLIEGGGASPADIAKIQSAVTAMERASKGKVPKDFAYIFGGIEKIKKEKEKEVK